MQDRDPSAQPRQSTGRRATGTAGGILAALAIAAAKFKALAALLLSFKWLVFAPKILLSFGTMFLSVWFYALVFGGWKIGIVFVLMILVHELGHLLTFRNFGVRASLPYFIPGFGAFVSSPMSADPTRNAVAALMGPVFGVAAAAACWGYGIATGEQFWIACAYIGFFLNLFNLLPAFPFDGGRIAGAIDGRLWIAGIVLLVGFIVYFHAYTAFTILILLFVLANSLPRIAAAFRGQVDPSMQVVSAGPRMTLALFYFALIAIAVAGAAATAHHSAAVR
ncbi:MAG TPA: site-2 protease family protein [Candidatus Baltobacteraceae bacterium]|nr:site-2 protease family protein [Candidatus Baltobacteraceae bacterium]